MFFGWEISFGNHKAQGVPAVELKLQREPDARLVSQTQSVSHQSETLTGICFENRFSNDASS